MTRPTLPVALDGGDVLRFAPARPTARRVPAHAERATMPRAAIEAAHGPLVAELDRQARAARR